MAPASAVDDRPAREALQRATDRLFYQRGVAGVTVAEIRDASGLSLRRIYRLCPSKADLVSLWLRHRHETWATEFRARVQARLEAGDDPVDAVFQAVEDWMVATGFRGCGFINTMGEQGQLDEEHVEVIRNHKRWMAGYLDSITGRGDAVAVLVDGAIVQASMFSELAPIRTARAAASAAVSGSRA